MSETAFEPIHTITQMPLVIETENVDTDQIFAAKFLTITERAGLGDYAFYDWRRDESGAEIPDYYLNTTPVAERQILLAGRNFGCGSSREHAPWALYDYGVRVVIGTDIADIFFNNCLKNGMAAVRVSTETYQALLSQKDAPISFDLEAQEIRAGDGTVFPFEMDGLARQCLLAGKDQLDLLLDAKADIAAFEAARV